MGSQGGAPDGERARAARVPGRRALPHAQQLGRELRPLHRVQDHPQRTVTDIEATVRLTAETGFLDVVSRPEQERRWTAVLLVDASPSLQVWDTLPAELRALFARSGVFRAVHVRGIDPRNPAGPGRGQRPGATLTFLLTDGTSDGWRDPRTVAALEEWGRAGPLAVLNPLPRRLWRGTALEAVPRKLLSPGAFAPARRLSVRDPLSGERDPAADGALALPVLHPTASALRQWAGLLTRPGVPRLLDTALLDGTPVSPRRLPKGSAEELVAYFRGAFSPEAYRLAVRLSAIRPLTTQLMQLVRAATMRDAGPTHVAEILLGGLLEPTGTGRETAAARTIGRALRTGPAGGRCAQPVYDFRPGVRDLLSSGLGAEAAVEVVEAVGRSLEPYMGRLPDFPVLMGDAAGEMRLKESARAFAVLASPVLERMGGTPGATAPPPAPPVRSADAQLPTSDGLFDVPPGEPSDVPSDEPFIGRGEEAARLLAGLTQGGDDGAGGEGGARSPRCLFLYGPPGVGKSALARRVAREAAEHFPDGRLFVSLRRSGGAGGAASEEPVAAALAELLARLGESADGLPTAVGPLAARYRSRTEGRRLLLVIDDVSPASGDAAVPPELLPAGPGSAVLGVGTRRQDPGALLLTGLRTDEARELLGALIGAERVAAEPEAADALVAATAGLPAALRTAADRITASGRPLAEWHGERPDALFPTRSGSATATGSAAAWVDGVLAGPPARRAFRMLAVPDGEAISRDAAAALLDVPVARLTPVLAELVAAGLVTESGPDRYRHAGLLRPLARDLALRELSASTREAGLARLLEWYLVTGQQIHRRRYPGDRLPDELAGSSRKSGPPAGERSGSQAGWADEMPQVLALVRQVAAESAAGAASGGGAFAVRSHVALRRAADLLLVAQPAAESGVYGAEFGPAARIVADRAALEGEHRAEGRARLVLAEALAARGRFAAAETEVRRADRAGRAADDSLTRFRAPLAHGLIALHQGRFDDAERQLTPAWERCRSRRDTLGEATVLAALARVWAAGGAGGDAVPYAEWSVGAYQRVGRTPRLAHGLYALAEALAADGRSGEALRRISEALPLFDADGQDLWAARARSRMAQAMVAVIRPHDALNAAQDAAARLMAPGGERWRADALTVLGRAESALGHQQSAEAHWRDALAVYEEFDATADADEIRALLRERPGAPVGTSRTAEQARAGTALRDLTAAVRVLRDRLRLRTAGRSVSGARARQLAVLAAAEARLAARLAAFARTGRPDAAAGAEEERLRAVAAQLAASDASDAGLTAAARDVARRLGR